MAPHAPHDRLHAQAEMLANRVKKTWKHLHKQMAKDGVEAFRLFDRDIPELRLVLDWYAGHAVLAEYVRDQTDFPEFLPTMADAVAGALAIPRDHVHVKQRRTGARGHRYARLATTDMRLPVREGPLTLLCNLDDFIDTGLYADHRLTRKRVLGEAKDQRFLNLFAYTGAFTVAAAAGGAQETTSVDVSQAYLDWAADNLRANGLEGPQHTFAAIDVPSWLQWAARQGKQFDLCVVDPPSFSTNRAQGRDFDILRDHPELLAAVLDVMAPGGVVYFSTNHQRFEPRLDGLAADVTDITASTIPVDYRNSGIHRCWRLVAHAKIDA